MTIFATKSNKTKTTAHILLLFIAICLLATTSCTKQQTSALKATLADSLIAEATGSQDLERVIFLADSLENTGDISIFRSCYMKGSVYTRTGKPQVEKHRNGADPNDDLTMMCLKINT